MRSVDVLVIGAGQAGLSAAYHLQRREFVPITRASVADRTFVVLDSEDGPGGAWQHRWASLKMATVNGIYELPGFPVPPADPEASSRDVLPAYFGDYEQRFALDVQRPVRVRAVRRATSADGADADSPLIVETDSGTWSAGHVINATGTWTRPHWPHYPGMQSFRGRQLHVRDYVSAEEFAGKRVVIVGAGISATQLLEEISRVADTLWVTRTEPEWKDGLATPTIVEALARAEERVREGLPPQSIVRVTGMIRTPWTERADERGVLVRHPMFTRIEEHGVRMPDGSFEPADVILWATGFRAELKHLAPLRLRTQHGGIRVANGRSLDEPRLFVIGYGPSQSTIGANRAGRDAVISILANPAPTEVSALPA
ncbi:NAD(P)-binding domain-containing protein [Actinomadura sp. 7K507]|uniref:NAD(P)-binding domain-containing protein n=1 Tax=Actinomadura sp. 7K507 TaxID=2530365 RepID=UPI0010502029|nr:NAD(P)-binding domain-containing protein [Actinomadura sp. 7K507]TDC80151.1 pyridine nucleotide-disulfide oxidoreductase [Actinomadura sp. 7K507]